MKQNKTKKIQNIDFIVWSRDAKKIKSCAIYTGSPSTL